MAVRSVVPTRIVPGKWWSMERIGDLDSLKPKPLKETLLIVGDATGVLEDLDKILDMCAAFGVDFDTLAVNYSVVVIPWEIDHFVAGDSHMKDMQGVARDLVPAKAVKHCWNPNSIGFDVRWVRSYGGGWDGTSATLALRVGLGLDYTRLILAGCPMDGTGNWYSKTIGHTDIKKHKDHRHHLWKWAEIAGRPIGRFVRSMSGNTKDLFGYPTTEWLLGLRENEEALKV